MGANRKLVSYCSQLTTVEVFKFATYLFIPLFAMLHFGDPDW